MTVKLVPIDSITINRNERQRRDLGDLTSLQTSLSLIGQLNPITVTSDLILTAGERRYTAATNLGWDTILVHIRDEEPTETQRLIELEENLERSELEWKDQAMAFLDLHTILSERNERWSLDRTATWMGKSKAYVSKQITLATALAEGDAFVCAADRSSVAYNYLVRKLEREQADDEDKLADMLGIGTPAKATPQTSADHNPGRIDGLSEGRVDDQLEPDRADLGGDDLSGELDLSLPEPEHPFINADFSAWHPTYTGPKFNFIHCDFPYGIDVEKHHGSGSSFEGYADSRDVYFNLLEELSAFTETHVSPSAHLLFWYAFRYHGETVDALERMGWKVQERPLIWYRSDNSGVLPDPKRGPRWVYETALMATRGDRPVVQAVSNLIPFPNQKSIHKSEKPVNMLHHFFRMFVDSSTVMIDPTAGSGNAVATCEHMGAKSALGIEMNKDFYEAAIAQYLKDKAMFRKFGD
jgi:ParB family chromosome partitioning protein